MAKDDNTLLLAAGLGALYFATRSGTAQAATTPPGGGGASASSPPAGGGKPPAGGGKTPGKKPPPKQIAPPKGKAGASTLQTAPSASAANKRIAGMKARAYQKSAQGWVAAFVRAGASQAEAEGLARWAGLESSGNPLAVSPVGERGLLQCTKTTALMAGGPFTASEWAMLIDRKTDRETHAKLAIKQFRWHTTRAKVAASAPAIDRLWYAKTHHQRPADLRTASKRPDSKTAAKIAASQAKQPREQIRVAAANMVAFGSVSPP